MSSERAVDEVANDLLEGVGHAAYLRDYVFGIKPGQSGVTWDPVYPYHRAPRTCPFCDRVYRRHAGFADHRDNCEAGPNPGANPAGMGTRGTMHPTIRHLQVLVVLTILLALTVILAEVITV